MANSLARYGNVIENVNKGKWPYEFGLYKYDPEKGGVPVRVVIVVVVAVSACVFGALLLAYFLTYDARDDDLEIMAIAFNDTREPAPTFELLDDNVVSSIVNNDDNDNNDSSNNDTTISLLQDDQFAEKWTLEDALDDIHNNESPSPFVRKHRGRPPTEFSTTTTSKPTYPQLTNYKSPYAPKNIQEILGYMSPSSHHSTSNPFAKEKPTQLHPYFVKIQNEIRRNPSKRSKYEEQEDDPFFSYKPRDPGDVNLLATASLRFSPPAWSSFKEPTTKSPSTAMPEFIKPGSKENRKPLMLTLNIYPMENELAASNHFPVTEAIGSGHRRPEGQREEKKLKKREKPNKMIIHLNLYTNPLGNVEGGRRNGHGVMRN